MFNGLLISSICTNLLIVGGMCDKTTEAVTKQFGIYQSVDETEKLATSYIIRKADDTLSPTTKTLAAYSFFAYKSYNNKEVRFDFKIPDFCDKVEVSGSKNKQVMSFNWSF